MNHPFFETVVRESAGISSSVLSAVESAPAFRLRVLSPLLTLDPLLFAQLLVARFVAETSGSGGGSGGPDSPFYSLRFSSSFELSCAFAFAKAAESFFIDAVNLSFGVSFNCGVFFSFFVVYSSSKIDFPTSCCGIPSVLRSKASSVISARKLLILLLKPRRHPFYLANQLTRAQPLLLSRNPLQLITVRSKIASVSTDSMFLSVP